MLGVGGIKMVSFLLSMLRGKNQMKVLLSKENNTASSE